MLSPLAFARVDYIPDHQLQFDPGSFCGIRLNGSPSFNHVQQLGRILQQEILAFILGGIEPCAVLPIRQDHHHAFSSSGLWNSFFGGCASALIVSMV